MLESRIPPTSGSRKARKLEDQLYFGAPSLNEYHDKRMLKHCLKQVAHAITAKYHSSKKRSSSGSTANRSLTTSNLHLLQSQVNEQRAVAHQTTSSSLALELLSLQSLVIKQQQKMPLCHPVASSIMPANLASLQASMAMPNHQIRQHSSNVITPQNSMPPSIAAKFASFQAISNHQRQCTTASMTARNNSDLFHIMNNADGHIHPARIPHGVHHSSLDCQFQLGMWQCQAQPNTLEEQQAANQKLQEQILEKFDSNNSSCENSWWARQTSSSLFKTTIA